MESKIARNISFGLLTVLLILVTLVAFMTYKNDGTSTSPLYKFAVLHHTEIMAGLVSISVLFGYASAQIFYQQLQKNKQDTRNILAVVLLFLSREEREIVNYLVAHKGITTQAEIARLPHMNRVKAHRSLQKMQEKQIITLIAHGKVRKVHLRENILQLLLEK